MSNDDREPPDPGIERAPPLVSPSLQGRAESGPAFEIKFVLERAIAERVHAWARASLSPDAYADPALGDAYEITTTYLDTRDLDIARRLESRTRKFRLRRYGHESAIWLEQKRRRGDRVRKRRACVPEAEIGRLATSERFAAWSGAWFHDIVHARSLRPACCVAYRRVAYFGIVGGRPIRLTMDSGVRGMRLGAWCVPEFDGGQDISGSRVICELKFSDALPAPFHSLITQMQLVPSAFSKYRRLMESSGALQVGRNGSA